MNNKDKPHEFAQEWERATERAREERRDPLPLADDALNDAAGLHVQSGVKGGWTHTCSCGGSCASQCAC
jgi:hypothetical protein